MNRPYIIIHTHTSIDGNINAMALPEFKAGSQHYQDRAGSTWPGSSWIV